MQANEQSNGLRSPNFPFGQLDADTLDDIDGSLFDALQNMDLDQLASRNLLTVLPFMTRLLLTPSFTKRKQILKLLYPIRKTNDVIQLMLTRPIEPHEISPNGVPSVSKFECGKARDRLIIVASEYLNLQERTRKKSAAPSTYNAILLGSKLFDNPLYIDDISYCLSVLLANTTVIPAINLLDMCEVLLHVKFGHTYIARLVTNAPDRCQEVCQSLINFGDKQDEGANFSEVSDQRAKTIRLLCLMNPAIALTIRSVTLQVKKVPSLTIMITLDILNKSMEAYRRSIEDQISMDDMDGTDRDKLPEVTKKLEETYDSAISFITGILLGADEATKAWFALYIKSAQQKRIDQNHFTILTQFRSEILSCIDGLFFRNNDEEEPEYFYAYTDLKKLNRKLIRAAATLRFYCALRGIGMLKPNPEESEMLMRLITCKPAPSQTSVNYATLCICTLLVCSTLISNHKDERRAAEWLKWIMKESNYSDSIYSSQGKSSISQLLLLIATHFQNNQINQVAELVCNTLSMQLQIKASVSKCKSLFVQELFNHQLITDHGVKDGDIEGAEKSEKSDDIEDIDDPGTSSEKVEFLPINCIHQLLENRSLEMLGLSNITSLGQTKRKSTSADLISQLSEGFDLIDSDPLMLARTIGSVLVLPKEDIWNHVDVFILNWSKILSLKNDSKKLIRMVTKLWWKLNTILPRKLWVMTINSLRCLRKFRSASELKSFEYSWDELTKDPLIVLRCDGRVFRSPDFLNIVLYILDAFLAASKSCLQNHISDHINRQKDARNLEELRATLVLAQTSAAIQILLESCIPTTNEMEIINKRDLCQELSCEEKSILFQFNASVDCICDHLHQVFIADTNLAKLVHFQTYPSELLVTTSEKIPSMHICLDFIPELLSQPDITKQVFVIELTSHLCEKYAITKSLNVAKLCLNVAYTLLQLLPSVKRAQFFIPVLPALLRICKIFPILQEDARIILDQIDQITLAHIASTSSRLSLGSAQPFAGLSNLTWREVKKLMSNFDLNEALYLCIQRCSLDLSEMELKYKQQNPVVENCTPPYSTIFAYGNHVINPAGS